MSTTYAEPQQLQGLKIDVFPANSNVPVLTKQPNSPTFNVNPTAPGQLTVPNRSPELARPHNIPQRQNSLRVDGQYRTIDITPETTAAPPAPRRSNQISTGSLGVDMAVNNGAFSLGGSISYEALWYISGILDGTKNSRILGSRTNFNNGLLEKGFYEKGFEDGSSASKAVKEALRNSKKVAEDLWGKRPTFEIPDIRIPIPKLPDLKPPKLPEFKLPKLKFPRIEIPRIKFPEQHFPKPIPKPQVAPPLPVTYVSKPTIPEYRCQDFAFFVMFKDMSSRYVDGLQNTTGNPSNAPDYNTSGKRWEHTVTTIQSKSVSFPPELQTDDIRVLRLKITAKTEVLGNSGYDTGSYLQTTSRTYSRDIYSNEKLDPTSQLVNLGELGWVAFNKNAFQDNINNGNLYSYASITRRNESSITLSDNTTVDTTLRSYSINISNERKDFYDISYWDASWTGVRIEEQRVTPEVYCLGQLPTTEFPPPPPPEDDCCRMGCCPKPTEIDYKLIKRLMEDTLKEMKFTIEVPICKCEYNEQLEAWEPKTNNTQMEVFATNETQAKQIAQLHIENARQMADLCIGRNKEDLNLVTPEWWQVRTFQRPQLVIQYAELVNGKLGRSRWSTTIPHYNKNKDYKPNFPQYEKGDFEGILVLNDNSKIIINARTKPECLRVINALKSFADPRFLKDIKPPKIGERPGSYRKVRVVPVRCHYFSTGQKNNMPDWSLGLWKKNEK